MKWGVATALLGLASSLALAPAAAADPAPPGTSWTADLRGGEAAGVVLDGDAARIDPATAFVAVTEDAPADAPADATADAPADATAQPTGLLTFPARRLPVTTDRVTVTVTGRVPAGATATVDVRARRPGGGWTEWVPAAAGAGGPAVPLPVASTEVQARLVLAGDPADGPAVHEVALTAVPAPPGRAESAERADALSYRVFATREGLVGGRTANGHVIADRDHFVALPSRRALSPRDKSDYSVRVCAHGRCAFAPVWDVGPWNTRDDYWNPGSKRQEWRDLPQGVPQAQAAHQDGYNGGRDQYGRKVANPAGIDLGDGLFWDALGLTDNDWVDVEYLWTGGAEHLARVQDATDVHAAPDAAAEVVGLAAGRASVPVECAWDGWLRVGPDQYVAATAVPDPPRVGACPGTPADRGTHPAETGDSAAETGDSAAETGDSAAETGDSRRQGGRVSRSAG